MGSGKGCHASDQARETGDGKMEMIIFRCFCSQTGADERIEGSVMTSHLDLCSSDLEGFHRIDFPLVSYLN